MVPRHLFVNSLFGELGAKFLSAQSTQQVEQETKSLGSRTRRQYPKRRSESLNVQRAPRAASWATRNPIHQGHRCSTVLRSMLSGAMIVDPRLEIVDSSNQAVVGEAGRRVKLSSRPQTMTFTSTTHKIREAVHCQIRCRPAHGKFPIVSAHLARCLPSCSFDSARFVAKNLSNVWHQPSRPTYQQGLERPIRARAGSMISEAFGTTGQSRL